MSLLYVTERAAVEAGMTHEGRMFGVPAWLAETGDNEITGTPKVPLLQLWCLPVDWLMEQFMVFFDEETVVETPIQFGRRIAR